MGLMDKFKEKLGLGTYTEQNKANITAIVKEINGYSQEFKKLSNLNEEEKENIPKLIEENIRKRFETKKNKSPNEIIGKLEILKNESFDILNEIIPTEKENFTIKTQEYRDKINNKLETIVKKELEENQKKSKDQRLSETKIREKVFIENKSSIINEIMPEAYALCKEATGLITGRYHYDVQLEAATAMSKNAIAQMKTGEGKTLVQTLVAYIDALYATSFSVDKENYGTVHVITANDFLAKENAYENSLVYALLGLTCGYAEENKDSTQALKERRKSSFNCDIVYTTAQTVGFTYLNDNRIKTKEDKVLKRPLYSSIVDEADDILLDQATTPLVLTASPNSDDPINRIMDKSDQRTQKIYELATNFIHEKNLEILEVNQYDQNTKTTFPHFMYSLDNNFVSINNDFIEDIFNEKPEYKFLNEELLKYFEITDEIKKELFFNDFISALENCVKAIKYEKKYKVEQINSKQSKIVLIGEDGREKVKSKLKNGLQEAIEALETYKQIKKYGTSTIIKSPSTREVGRITYPNLIGLYQNVSGMTGTSDEHQFEELYGLPTYVVPSRKPNIRIDHESELYATKDAKYNAIVTEVLKIHNTGQPILIGTTSVQESNEICKKLGEKHIYHQRLDAVNNKNEKGIVEKAGCFGMVTVATNMAGRGTDIKLGDGVRELGGLYVLATSKNNNKRIDNQLIGRAARQGDPGVSKYYQSLEDEMVRKRFLGTNYEKELDKYKNQTSKIEDEKLQKIVNHCQEIQEENDKLTRKRNEEYGQTVSKISKFAYEQRNEVLQATTDQIMQIIKKIMTDYTSLLVLTSDYEGIKLKIGHIIDVDECYVKESVQESYKNIGKSLSKKLLERITTLETDKIREMFLDVMDNYWISLQTEFNDIEKYCSNNKFNIMDKEKPKDIFARKAFDAYKRMKGCMYNEMLTFILTDLKLGEYEVKFKTEEIENEYIL